MGAQNPKGGRITRAIAGMVSPQESLSYADIKQVTELEGPVFMHEFDNPDAHQIQLAHELSDVFGIDDGEKRSFGAVWLNRHLADENGSDVLLISNPFLTDNTKPDTKQRLYFMAREFPDHQLVAIDQPGHGRFSTNYGPKVIHQFMHGDMTAIGNSQTQAFSRFARANLGLIKSISMKAESLGFRQGIELVLASQETPYAIRNAVGFELPGTEKNRRAGMHASYFGYEALRSSYYKSKWIDPSLELFGSFLDEYGDTNRLPASKSFLRKDKLMAAANFWNSCLGHGTGQETLGMLVQQGVQVVRVVGEVSRIDRFVAAREQHLEFPDDFGSNFGLLVLRGESHDATGTYTRARLAPRLARHALENSATAVSLERPVEFYMRDVQAGLMPAFNDPEFVAYVAPRTPVTI